MNTTLFQNRLGETNLHSKPHDYRIYSVNIDLHYQYGISVAESQTFLLAKRPLAAMSKEKHLQFTGWQIFFFAWIAFSYKFYPVFQEWLNYIDILVLK